VNKAEELLQRLEARATERAQSLLFLPLAVYAGGLLLPLFLGFPGVFLALLLATAVTLRTMFRLQRIMRWTIGEAATVYAVCGRIVEFRVVPELHIVGAE